MRPSGAVDSQVAMNEHLKRYRLFGWDYELLNPISDKERDWYIGQARDTGGPVLEMACGSGRLLVFLAECGFECHGLDISDEMIQLAEKRISGISKTIRENINLHKKDITNFRLPMTFGLAIIADNSLRDLTTIEMQKACIERALEHLRPGGRLLVTLRRLEPKELVNGTRETGWSEAVVNPRTGEAFRRKVVMQLSENGRKAKGYILYRPAESKCDEDIIECPFEFPVLSIEEHTFLFNEVGFRTKLHVGYEHREDDGREVILCFVCDKDRK